MPKHEPAGYNRRALWSGASVCGLVRAQVFVSAGPEPRGEDPTPGSATPSAGQTARPAAPSQPHALRGPLPSDWPVPPSDWVPRPSLRACPS